MRFAVLGLLILSQTVVAQINSVATGDWDDPNTWDCACVPDVNSFDDIIVNHNIAVTNDINLNRVTITNGNTVTINGGVTVTIEEDFVNTPLIINAGGALVNNGTLDLGSLLFFTPCDVSGTLESSSTITIFDPSVLVFNSGSTYRHNHASGGDIPVAIWDSNSTVEISGLTNTSPAAPNNLNQTFGNFTWNTPSMGSTSTFSLGGQLTNVQGNLTFLSTGTTPRVVRLANGGSGYSLNIGRDFILSGGTVFLTQSLSSATTITVGTISSGNFTHSGGNLSFAVTNSNEVNLDIAGHFSKSGGSLTSGSGTGARRIRFNGSGADQNYSVNLLTAAFDFIVQSGAVLNLGTSALITSGTAGTFTLSGTVRLGSTSSSGAIQAQIPMTTRTFNSGSTIAYNGSSGRQYIGSAHPTSSGVNVIVNNSSHVEHASGVDVTIGGNLTLTTGNIIVPTGRTLTMNGTFSAGPNSIEVTSGSNISIGNSASAFGTLVLSGSATINNLTIARPGQPVTLGSDLTVNGTFSLDASAFNYNDRTFTIGNNFTPVSGSLVGNSSSTLIITGLGTVGTVPLTGTLGTLTIDQPSGVVNTTSITIANALNILTGTYSGAGSVTLNAGVILTRRDGTVTKTLTATNYNLVYTNTAAISTGNELITSPSTALNNLTVNGSNTVMLNAGLTTVTVNGALTLSTGIFDSNAKALTLLGNLVSNATGTFTGSTITFAGNSTLSGSVALVLPDVSISSGATLNLGSGTVDFTGNIDHDNGGTLNAGTGTARFAGTTTITSNTLNTPRFNNLEVLTGSSLTLNCVSNCGAAPSQFSIEVAGNWNSNNSGSTFAPGGGRVVLNGINQSLATLSSHSFFGLQMLGTGTVTLSNSLRVNNNLILGPNATLNTGSSQPVTIGGNFVVNGSLSTNQSTFTFNGTGNQKIDRESGSGAVNRDFYNITVNKSSGTFNVQSTIANTTFRVSNEFRISQNGGAATDVDFDGPSNTGVLILLSTASATAKIPAVPASTSVVGNVTVQRYIQNDDAARAWRYFAPSVVGTTVADWQGEIQITGQFSNPSTGPGIPNPNVVSLYRWVETAGGVESNRWSLWPNNIAQPASSFALNNAEGYSIFVRDQGTPTMDVRGTLRSGDVGVSLTRTGTEVNAAGYNLVGNPYPAPIDWDLISLPAGVSTTVSLKDNVSNANLGGGQFVYYVQGGPDIGNFTGVIASSQAFWVELTTGSSQTLTISESHKASDMNPVVVRERTIANLLRIKLNGVDSRDETVIYFDEEATDGFDLAYDAKKLTNDYINLYSILDNGARYAINGLGGVDCSRLIKLGINQLSVNALPLDPDLDSNLGTGEDITPLGTYTFEFSGLDSFGSEYQFSLIDKFTGIIIDISKQDTYTFEVTEDVSSRGEGRFEVMLSQAEIENDKLLIGSDICAGMNASIVVTDAQPGISYYATLEGTTVSQLVSGSGQNVTIEIKESNLAFGQNQLLVYGQRPGCDPVPMMQAVSIKRETIYEPSVLQAGLACQSGSVSLVAGGAPKDGSYKWYHSSDAADPIDGQVADTFITPDLVKTTTYFVSVVNSLGCEGARIPVVAQVVNYDDVEVIETENTLSSSYAEGNQWYLDGEIIEGATQQTYVPEASGYYEVRVSIGECESIAGRQFTVTAIEDNSWLGGGLRAYPNPVSDVLYVEIHDDAVSALEITDVLGRAIGPIKLEQVGSSRVGSFDFADRDGGLYLLRLKMNNGKVSNQRIIKR
ncbi:MAG: T9SS type A sorting domain-containing protein [Cyclobacteriaceae bacterium]